jgi:hypothetical protein
MRLDRNRSNGGSEPQKARRPLEESFPKWARSIGVVSRLKLDH